MGVGWGGRGGGARGLRSEGVVVHCETEGNKESNRKRQRESRKGNSCGGGGVGMG